MLNQIKFIRGKFSTAKSDIYGNPYSSYIIEVKMNDETSIFFGCPYTLGRNTITEHGFLKAFNVRFGTSYKWIREIKEAFKTDIGTYEEIKIRDFNRISKGVKKELETAIKNGVECYTQYL